MRWRCATARARSRRPTSATSTAPRAQEIIARNFYRPRDPQVAARYAQQFPALKLVSIADFGGWAAAQKTHFSDGGVFDQLTAR